MPNYISTPQVSQVKAIAPGNQIALVNDGSVDTGVTKTLQAAIARVPGAPNGLTVVNTTTQTATLEVANQDVDGDYQPFTDGDTGTAGTVATNTTKRFTCDGPWIRFTFGTAPTSGSLIVAR